ncbi:MAG: protein-glutamate O-methyltransferase CheR [Firmicutes bacterium]|nr:protein-glutamate O-methyltransferase CheR [Bacillota bacterium]
MNRNNYALFCYKVHQLTGLNLALYKDRQMKRRLNAFMYTLEVNNYLELGRKLEQDKAALDKFCKFVTINVTEFFRGSEQFKTLQEKILPQLIRPGVTFKAWSAGCSDGSEPYSLVMILEEMGLTNYQIHATDLNSDMLAKAKVGVYAKSALEKVPDALVAKYFVKASDKAYQFDSTKARNVKFYQQDLLKDPYKKCFDLIICRNVVIYFTEEAKDLVFMKMAKSLRKGGILFVGGTESILAAEALGLKTELPFFYRKDTIN